MTDLRQFQKVTARFKPRRIEDLHPGVLFFVGEVGRFEALYTLETGEYRGEWAMQAPIGWTFGWCPEGDLEIIGQ